MAKLILGIAGEMGSGKGMIAKHIVEERHGKAHNFAQIINDILTRLHLDITRENQTPLSGALRNIFGEDILAKVMYKDSVEDTNDIVVVQGIRREHDMELFKKIPNFKFIFVDADMETRYERVKKRHEKANDATMTFEEFRKTHEYETEQTIADLKNYADYVIDNNGTYVELYNQVETIIKDNLGE